MLNQNPEEEVRQRLLKRMVEELGYPASLIAVEKRLESVNRRFDLVCYAKAKTLYPLLIIECKAHPLTRAAIDQVIGYNHEVQAYYIGVANQTEVRVGWFDGEGYQFVNDLPPYDELVATCG